MNRRSFLKSTGVIAASGIIPAFETTAQPKGLKKIGIQLFSLPKLLEKDFRNAIRMLAGVRHPIGFQLIARQAV